MKKHEMTDRNVGQPALLKRSDSCMKLVHDTAKAVSLSVSVEMFNQYMPVGGVRPGLYEHVQASILNNIINSIQEMNTADKMDLLDNIAKETPNNTVAWRPVTGKVDTSGIEKWGLSSRKLNLENKLEALRKANEKLKKLIIRKRKIIQQRKVDIDTVRL